MIIPNSKNPKIKTSKQELDLARVALNSIMNDDKLSDSLPSSIMKKIDKWYECFVKNGGDGDD